MTEKAGIRILDALADCYSFLLTRRKQRVTEVENTILVDMADQSTGYNEQNQSIGSHRNKILEIITSEDSNL